jgi:hypothetical protein
MAHQLGSFSVPEDGSSADSRGVVFLFISQRWVTSKKLFFQNVNRLWSKPYRTAGDVCPLLIPFPACHGLIVLDHGKRYNAQVANDGGVKLMCYWRLSLDMTCVGQQPVRLVFVLKLGGPSHVKRGECSPRQVAFLSFCCENNTVKSHQPRMRFCALHALCIARETPRL